MGTIGLLLRPKSIFTILLLINYFLFPLEQHSAPLNTKINNNTLLLLTVSPEQLLIHIFRIVEPISLGIFVLVVEVSKLYLQVTQTPASTPKGWPWLWGAVMLEIAYRAGSLVLLRNFTTTSPTTPPPIAQNDIKNPTKNGKENPTSRWTRLALIITIALEFLAYKLSSSPWSGYKTQQEIWDERISVGLKWFHTIAFRIFGGLVAGNCVILTLSKLSALGISLRTAGGGFLGLGGSDGEEYSFVRKEEERDVVFRGNLSLILVLGMAALMGVVMAGAAVAWIGLSLGGWRVRALFGV